jgi:phosphatidylglycerol:prolipoprotein diacylglycerol transferase
MIHFLHTFNPEPILISLGPVNIYWYGFFVLLGALAAISVALKLASYYNIKKDTIIDLAFWLIIGGIIGARIYHVLLELPYYLSHPLNIFKIWQGGLAIHGGIIAGGIIIWIFAKKLSPLLTKEGQGGGLAVEASNNKTSPNLSLLRRGSNFWLLAAILAPGLALAQAIGRWGNYFNQELFGKPTNLPWGIPINIANRPAEYLSSKFFHPTFLYESLGNLLIFIILISIHIWIIKQKRITNYELRITNFVLIVICYLMLYSALRFCLEFIRVDATPELLGLRFPQIISLLIIFLTPLILLLPKLKKNANIK